LEAPARRIRLADGRTLGYDVLSLDTGSVMERHRIPGAHEHALFVRPIETFLAQFEQLLDQAARRELEIVVLGGGAAGVELALALQHRLGGRQGDRGGGWFGRGAREQDRPARVALVLGGAQLLAGYAPEVVRHAERLLAAARVTLFREPCTEVRESAVVLASGARVACDVAVVATGSEAPVWLAGSALALDGHGFIVTGPTLQSGSHPEVFAAGDVATRIDEPHAKSGVYAVRAGPPLARNLRAFVTGQPLQRYVPPRRTLNLISGGARRAIVAWGGFTAEGRWAWWCKDRIDRRFIARYRVGDGAVAPSIPSAEMR
jgi:NADH dehydrogenase FAD-containing subunit